MNALDAFLQTDWAERAGWTLLHSIWQIALVTALYAIATLLFRNRSANARYILGCVALLAMLGLPLGTYLLLTGSAEPVPAVASDASNVEIAIEPLAEPSQSSGGVVRPSIVLSEALELTAPPEPAPVEPEKARVALSSGKLTASKPVSKDLHSRFSRYLPWATAGWLMGVLLLSLRPVWGWFHMRRLRSRGLSPVSAKLQRTGRRVMRRLGVRRAVQFAESALVEVPTIIGFLRPMVLLPASAITGLSVEGIELILAHELAHVRRHDWLTNLVQTVIEALLFYHPGMWWVSSQIRKERENCCDDMAVTMGGNRTAYVRALAQLEQQRAAMPAVALTATGGVLLNRVRRLLGQPTSKYGYGHATAWLAGLFTIGVIAGALALNSPAKATPDEDPTEKDKAELAELERRANPFGLSDDKLVKMVYTHHELRDVAHACRSYYREQKRLPRDIASLVPKYLHKGRFGIASDPLLRGAQLRLIFVEADSDLLGDENAKRLVRIWSVGPDGDWDGGRVIDSTKEPLDGDIGIEIRPGDFKLHWLADDTIRRHMEGKRLAHYLALKGPKLPKPELKDDGLKWGPVVDGLQMAVELTRKTDLYYLGETIPLRFHVRNAVDYAVQIGLQMPRRQDGTFVVRDKDGKVLKGQDSGWGDTGTVYTKQTTLKPGESAQFVGNALAFVAPGSERGIGVSARTVEATPGVYTANFKYEFPTNYDAEPREWRGELETAPITIRIAEMPKFAIHRVKGYYSNPAKTMLTYFRNNYKPGRFDSTRPEKYPLDDLLIDNSPLITDADITSYDWQHHVVTLKPGVRELVAKGIKPDIWGMPFVVQVEGEPIYLGAFWNNRSSVAARVPMISLAHTDETLPADAIRIDSRWGKDGKESRDDPRRDQRVHQALQKAEKLLNRRSGETPWGKPVEGVKTRLRPGEFRDGAHWMTFDLQNNSSDLSVQLGPGDMPVEILVDGVPYGFGGEIAGQLPVCKPGQNSTCEFKLDKTWVSTAIIDVKNRLPNPLTPLTDSLTPGKHTVQAVVYATGKDEDENDRDRRLRVLSNSVEMSIVDNETPWGPKGTDGLQVRLIIPKKPSQSVPVLTDAQYFTAPPGQMDPQVRLEVKNAGAKTITLAETKLIGGPKNILGEWLVGLSLDMQAGETVRRLTRTDDEGRFWSATDGMEVALGNEIKPGETVAFGLRLVNLADEQGRSLAKLTGVCRLRPVLLVAEGGHECWHGTTQGEFVPVAIQDRGAEPADGLVVSEKMAAKIRSHVKPLTVTASQDIEPINRHRDWIRQHLGQSVPFLLEEYPSSPFIAGLLFDAWRQGLLTTGQKRLVTEGAVKTVAFEDRAKSFVVGTRKVKLDIAGVPMEEDWRPETHPQIPWDILDAQLTKVSVDADQKVDVFGSGKTQCNDSHFLRLPDGLNEGKHGMEVLIELAEKNGTWRGRVLRHLDFKITPPVDQHVRRAFHFLDTEGLGVFNGPVQIDVRGDPLMGPDPWEPQISGYIGSDRKEEGALHMPLWKVTEPLPVDLCFTVEFTVQQTGEVIEGEPLMLPREKATSGYFRPKRHPAFWKKYNGLVPVTITLKPFKPIGPEHTKLTNIWQGTIVSEPLRVRSHHFKLSDAPPVVKEVRDLLSQLAGVDVHTASFAEVEKALEGKGIKEHIAFELYNMTSLSPYRRRDGASCNYRDTPEVVPLLIRLLEDTDSLAMRSPASVAAQTLSEVGPAAISALIEALKQKNSAIQTQVVYVLNNMATNERRKEITPLVLPHLIPLLKDDHGPLREATAHALHRLIDPAAVQPLIEVLSDDVPKIRANAAMALGWQRDARAVEPLLKLLSDPNDQVRTEAASALGKIRAPKSVEPLICALKEDAYHRVRAEAAWGLAYLQDQQAVPVLLTALKDDSQDVVVAAAYGLGQMKVQSAVGPLIEIMQRLPNARNTTLEALKKITGQDFSLDADKWKAWYEKNKPVDAEGPIGLDMRERWLEVNIDSEDPVDDAASETLSPEAFRDHIKPLTAGVPQVRDADNPHVLWVGKHLKKAVPYLLEQYPCSTSVAGLLFDAWREGVLNDAQKKEVAEGIVKTVAFEDQTTKFEEGTRKVKMEITGVPMEKDWRPEAHPYIPWDFLEARLIIHVDKHRVYPIGGIATQCNNSHFLRLPEGLQGGKHRLDVAVEIREKEGVWAYEVVRKVDFAITFSIDEIEFEAGFVPEKNEITLGEDLGFTFYVKNVGKKVFYLETGGDGRGIRSSRFSITAVDAQGEKVFDPNENAMHFGGLMGAPPAIEPGESYTRRMVLSKWCRFDKPGKYTVTGKRTLNLSRLKGFMPRTGPGRLDKPIEDSFTITVLEPTPRQARARVDRMMEDRQGANFSVLGHPVYLPVLLDYAHEGDRHAIAGIASIHTPEATRALTELAEQWLADDKLELALAALSSITLPDWRYERNPEFNVAQHHVLEKAWRPDVAEPLRRMAVILARNTDQASLEKAGYILECVGEAEDLPAMMLGFTGAIEATKTLPFETHQYFRPRGASYRYRFTARRLLEKGGKAPTAPKTSGEMATMLIAMQRDAKFRPDGWQQQVIRWLKCDTPYMKEFVLDHMPTPVPDGVFELLPGLMADDYVDLQIAACKTAGGHPHEAFKEPLLKILKTAPQGQFGILLNTAAGAAPSNGIARDRVMEIWVERLDPADLGADAVVRLLLSILDDNKARTPKLKAEDVPQVKKTWLRFIDENREELRAGRRFKIGDPEITPDLFFPGFSFYHEGKPWPPEDAVTPR